MPLEGLRRERCDPVFSTEGHIGGCIIGGEWRAEAAVVMPVGDEAGGGERCRAQRGQYREVNSIGRADVAFRGGEEPTASPQSLAGVGEWRLMWRRCG